MVTGRDASGSGHASEGDTDTVSGKRTGAAPPSPRATCDEEPRAQLAGYRSRRALDDDHRLMGPSNGQ